MRREGLHRRPVFDWIRRFDQLTEWPEAVKRSLITVQALVDADTGGIVGAPTLGLPEVPHGGANWDYRYSWLRDSAFTLSAFLHGGFSEEARVWRGWLLRAIAGNPAEMRTMYRLDGAIHIENRPIPWLPGYEGAQPVCVGNAAAAQRQLDIYGEVLNSFYLLHHFGIEQGLGWDDRTAERIVEHVEQIWRWPDQGIWESRGAPKDFTHSKVMTWVAVDRFLRLAAQGIDNDRRQELERLRDTIHADVCSRAFDRARNQFRSDYNADHPDASLLRLQLMGFLPPEDPRMRGTVAAIENDLVEDRLVRRLPRHQDRPDEGAFLPCTCWLADCLIMQGRETEARAYFERFLAVRNDLGLLSEEWDARTHRLMGNFPQTISHVALINTALRLSGVIAKRKPTDKATTR